MLSLSFIILNSFLNHSFVFSQPYHILAGPKVICGLLNLEYLYLKNMNPLHSIITFDIRPSTTGANKPFNLRGACETLQGGFVGSQSSLGVPSEKQVSFSTRVNNVIDYL